MFHFCKVALLHNVVTLSATAGDKFWLVVNSQPASDWQKELKDIMVFEFHLPISTSRFQQYDFNFPISTDQFWILHFDFSILILTSRFWHLDHLDYDFLISTSWFWQLTSRFWLLDSNFSISTTWFWLFDFDFSILTAPLWLLNSNFLSLTYRFWFLNFDSTVWSKSPFQLLENISMVQNPSFSKLIVIQTTVLLVDSTFALFSWKLARELLWFTSFQLVTYGSVGVSHSGRRRLEKEPKLAKCKLLHETFFYWNGIGRRCECLYFEKKNTLLRYWVSNCIQRKGVENKKFNSKRWNPKVEI